MVDLAGMAAEGTPLRLRRRMGNLRRGRQLSLMLSQRRGPAASRSVLSRVTALGALWRVRLITGRRIRCVLLLRRQGICRIGWPSTVTCR